MSTTPVVLTCLIVCVSVSRCNTIVDSKQLYNADPINYIKNNEIVKKNSRVAGLIGLFM